MKVEECIVCCINLYGMIHISKVEEIYCKMTNRNSVNINEVNIFDITRKYPIFFEKDYFIHDSIYYFDDMKVFIDETNGKPFYLPELNEFKKYLDPYYIPRNKEYNKLYDYIHPYMKFNRKDTEDVIIDISTHFEAKPNPKKLANSIQRIIDLGHEFDDLEDLNVLTRLIMEYLNNFKIWNNRGYSPLELTSLTKSKENVKRNDPCPCGSGKKYKKCCIDKSAIATDPNLYYENVFKVTDEELKKYISEMKRYYDKVVPYIIFYKNPSYHDIFNFIESNLSHNIKIRPKDMVGALVSVLLRKHLDEDYEAAIETTFRKLGIWGMRDYVLGLSNDLEKGLDLTESNAELNRIVKESDETLKNISKKHPFKDLIKLQNQLDYDEPKFNHYLDLSIMADNYEGEEIDGILFILFCTYPLVYPILETIIPDIKDDEIRANALKAYMNAFEIVNKEELDKNRDEFTLHDDNKHYILAIDELGKLYKYRSQINKAIKIYELGLHYDDLDRFNLKEAILPCYLMKGEYQLFDETVDTLDDNSFYKPFLLMFRAIAEGSSFHKHYLDAYKLSKKVLDVFINKMEIDFNELETMESEFICDFINYFGDDSYITQELIELHRLN